MLPIALLLNQMSQDMSEFDLKKNWFEKTFPSLSSVKSFPKGFWKIDSEDMGLFKLQLMVIIVTWIFSMISGYHISFLAYWDGPNYVYAAKTMYNIPKINPWTRVFHYQPSYFACHLPGFPLVIKFFSMLFFAQYWLGDILAILFTSLVVTYTFRRFLIAYSAVSDPVWTTRISIFLPLRFFLYKCVGSSEPLFMSFCFLAFVFLKSNQMVFLLLSLYGACITRIEGFAIVGTIGLCYILRFDFIRAILTGLAFLSPYSIMLFHEYRFNDRYAYIHFNQGHQGLLVFQPFFALFRYTSNPNYMHMVFERFAIHIPFAACICVVFSVSIPLAIFSVVYFFYTSMLNHLDIARYSLPSYMPSLLIGMDVLFSSPQMKKHMNFVQIFVMIFGAVYSLGQISSNRCDHEFLMEVFF